MNRFSLYKQKKKVTYFNIFFSWQKMFMAFFDVIVAIHQP